MSFSFGSDPEFIIIDKSGRVKSAIGIVPGNKKKKLKVEDNLFFYDNVLAECTVSPSFSREEAIENIRKSLCAYSKILGDFKMTTIASAEFENEEMNHKDARESGCAVEYCAYELKSIPSQKIKKLFKKSNFRTAGGHVHLGTDLGKNHESCVMLVRMLDLFLGVVSIILDPCPQSLARREIYGKPGRYRQPNYGLEYRTLGNFWLASPELTSLVFDLCEITIRLSEEKIHEIFWAVDNEKLDSDEFWNSGGEPCDCHTCHGYSVKTLKRMFSVKRNQAIQDGSEIIDLIFRYIPEGMKQKIKNLEGRKFDMYKEWNLA